MNVDALNSRHLRAARLAGRVPHSVLRARFYLSLVLVDLCCVLGSFFLAQTIYGAGNDQWFVVAAVLAPVYFATALNAGAYSIDIVERPSRGMLRAARAFALSAGVVVLLGFYFKTSADFSRGMIGIGSAIGFGSIMVARHLFLRHARKLMGGNPYSVYLICDGTQPLDFSAFSFVIHASDELDPAQDCPAMYDRLAKLLQDADRVVVACPPERRLIWAKMLKGANIQAEIMADELVAVAPMGIGYWNGAPTFIVASGPLGTFDAILKRTFDLAIAGTALLLMSPAFLAIALAIKLESRGPVFFVQTRIGLGNRQFRMFKFRSMRVEQLDHSGQQSTRRDDNRITRVGAFIRRTSIDEIPQLLNVLIGDMSIVGPRPHALASRAADKLFWEIDERYWHRHAAKPGLTGLAQIRGYRGATEHLSDLTNRLQADLEYLHDWSIWRDIWITLHTFRVLVHKNAF